MEAGISPPEPIFYVKHIAEADAPKSLAFHGLEHSGFGEDASGVERGQWRGFGRNQQRNLGAAEHNGIAAVVLESADNFDMVCQRSRQELAVDQFVENDLVEAFALLLAGDAAFNARGLQR